MKKEVDKKLLADLAVGLLPRIRMTKILHGADLYSMAAALTGAIYRLAKEEGSEVKVTDIMFELASWALSFSQRGMQDIKQKYLPEEDEEDEDDGEEED